MKQKFSINSLYVESGKYTYLNMEKYYIFNSLVFFMILSMSNQKNILKEELEIVNNVIMNTFVHFKCLNLFSRGEILKFYDFAILFRTNFTFLNIISLNESNKYCGYLFLCENFLEFAHLDNFTFDLIPRILYLITQNTEDIFKFYQDKKRIFQDKDFVIVDLSDSNTSIYKQDRYQTELEKIELNFSKSFFHPPYQPQTAIDYKRRIVKLTTFHCPIFNHIIGDGNNQELGDGVETRIFKEIAKKLNLTWKIVPNDGKRWGTAYPNNTISGGILKHLYTGEADVGICSLWIEQSKFRYIVMSGYWNILCLRFLFPKPKIMPNHWATIFKPLPADLWIMIFLSTVITSVFCSGLNRVQRVIKTSSIEKTAVISSFITVIGTLFMAKNPNKYEGSTATKHLFLWWSVFALIITTLYSSSLVSHLTYPQHEPLLNTIEALVKANYYWGTPYEPPIKYIFNKNNTWHRIFAKRFKYETNTDNRLKRILSGNYSVFVKCIGNEHFMEVQNVPDNILHELRAPRSCLNYFYLGFGYRKALPYSNAADQIIATLVESGITEYWLNRVFEKEYSPTTFGKVYEYKTPPEDVQLQPLTLDNLQSVFFVFSTGIISSILMFIGEIFNNKLSNKKLNRA